MNSLSKILMVIYMFKSLNRKQKARLLKIAEGAMVILVSVGFLAIMYRYF